jgi:antitoxin MazE
MSKRCLNTQEHSMSNAVLDIKRWGNNLGVRLPAGVAREAHLHADQRVRVEVEKGRVIITPLENQWLTLEQRLERFVAAAQSGEAMATQPVGAERW